MFLVVSLALSAGIVTGTIAMSRECKLKGRAAFMNFHQCKYKDYSGPVQPVGTPMQWDLDSGFKNRIWEYSYQTTWPWICDQPKLMGCLKGLYTELSKLSDIRDCPFQVFYPFEIDTTDLKKNPFEAQANAHLVSEESDCEWGVMNDKDESCHHLLEDFTDKSLSYEFQVEMFSSPKSSTEKYCKWFTDLGCCGPSAFAYTEACVDDLTQDERNNMEHAKKIIKETCPGLDWSEKSHCKRQAPFVSGGDICKDHGFRVFQLGEVDRAKNGESLLKISDLKLDDSSLDDSSPASRASAAILLSATAVLVSLAAL